tara:strand:- start:5 stop:967 length:963 start_codon:yes stop_codon:yes gene_type:complete
MSNFLNFSGNSGVTFKSFTASGGTTYTLDKPSSTNSVMVSVGGVMQKPSTDYSVSGTTLTTTSTVTSGIVIDTWIIHDAGNAPVIEDNSIVTAKIANSQVTADKLDTNAVTNVKVADDAIGVAELSATGTASSSTYLRGDNSWAEAGGGALVHLSSQTASGSSSLDFTQISTTYNTYRFVFENIVNSSNNTSFGLRTSTDGGSSYDSGASDYFRTGFWENGGSITLNVGNEAHGYFNSAGVYSTASDGGLSGSLELYNPLGTSYTQWVATTIAADGTNDPTAHYFAGHRQSAEDVDAVQFKFDSGNIASGTIRMYGYVKS